MHYRYVSISIELARRLLILEEGDRFDSIKKLSEDFDVGRGTIQTALSRLVEDGALEIESLAQQGSYIKKVNRPLLLKAAQLEEVIGTLPITYSRLYLGLATGLHQAFENSDMSLILAQVRGAKNRLNFLQSSRCDFMIISKLTWNRIQDDEDLTLLFEFGPGSNVSKHVLLVRNEFANEISEGMRIGVDSSSFDHLQLTLKEFNGKNVQLVETSYGQTIDKLITGEIDATIWDAGIWDVGIISQPDSLRMIPLTQYEVEQIDNTIACLVVKKDNKALNQLLLKCINPEAVVETQKQVMAYKITPSF
ncbi:GntR family transcriptional regulator YhfZ [Sporosarcina sp.]|uniref:GntR family transcriptional regulator YhfZ n=1 Tax=Sporosarcina sp. TaxID=49982 RepID=UPI00261854A8|nr:GntR family transcriptional regulator YhfZ [Sporosarcina sp.]